MKYTWKIVQNFVFLYKNVVFSDENFHILENFSTFALK